MLAFQQGIKWSGAGRATTPGKGQSLPGDPTEKPLKTPQALLHDFLGFWLLIQHGVRELTLSQPFSPP